MSNNIPTKESLAEQALEIIHSSIARLLDTQGIITIGLAGGTSMQEFFTTFKQSRDLPWDKIHLFWVDERCVPLSHKESNYLFAYNLFLHPLLEEGLLPSENIHPFSGQELESYGEAFIRCKGSFDIIILSAGEDGHVASLFPGHHSIEVAEEGFFLLDDSPKAPSQRMTASKALLQTADTALLLFYGEEKRKALELYNDDSVDENLCPAKLIKAIPNHHILTDLL
jgi:6-phosphogluconolactonase